MKGGNVCAIIFWKLKESYRQKVLSNDYFTVSTIRDEGFLTVGFGQMLPIQLFYTGLDYLSLYEMTLNQGCRSLLSIVGDNLQFYSNFALFSTLGGMNLDHDFFQVSKSSEDQKKVFTKNGTLFSPNSNGDLRSDAHRS